MIAARSDTMVAMNEAPIAISRIDETEYSAALTQLEQSIEPPVSFLQAPLYGRLYITWPSAVTIPLRAA